jgi:hypothetical protein
MQLKTSLLIAALIVSPSGTANAQVPDWINQILTAAQLPVVTAEARREGVPNSEIKDVLDVMVKEKIPAHEATAVMDTARAVRRQHGPVDNFGAFVQTQLASGKRGRELAAAIRAEHAKRGKGKGARAAAAEDHGQHAAHDSARAGDKSKGRSGKKAADTGRGRGNPRPQR